MEPAVFCQTWETVSGVAPRSALAIEHRISIHSFFLLAVVDGIDVTQSAAAEHIARRVMQIHRAVKRCAKAPQFEGLEPYLSHMGDVASGSTASAFETFVAGELKTEGVYLKQVRLAADEREAQEKKKKGKKGGKDEGDA